MSGNAARVVNVRRSLTIILIVVQASTQLHGKSTVQSLIANRYCRQLCETSALLFTALESIVLLFHDPLRPTISHHTVCSVIKAHDLTPVKRDD